MSIDKALLGFDYNQALGVQYPVPQGLLGDNLETQMNVGGTLGGLGALIKTQQEGGGFGEGLYSYLVGDRAGRQQVVNTAATNYANKLNILSKQNQLARDPYELAKLKFDVEKQPYELGELRNKFYESSYKIQGMEEEMLKLAREGRYDELTAIQANPKGYFDKKTETNINNQTYSQGELSAAQALGLDVKKRSSWSDQDIMDFDAVTNAPSVEEANKINRENLAKHLENPQRYPRIYEPSRNEVLGQIRKQRKGTVRTSSTGQEEVVQPAFTSTERSNIPLGYFPANEQYPEGGVKGSDGKIYSMEDFDKQGVAKQDILLNEYLKPDDIAKETSALFKEAKKDHRMSKYAHKTISRSNRAIERLLEDPEKMGRLFDYWDRGVITFDQKTNFFLANEMEAQDIKNLLETVGGQQFTNEIQDMRANNQTGGAVGNVSDREVEMFKNMAANLRYSGTREELYTNLVDLYNQGNGLIKSYNNTFKDYYGENTSNRYKIDEISYNQKQFGSYAEEIAKQRDTQAARVFGVPRKEEQQQFENNDGFKLRNVR